MPAVRGPFPFKVIRRTGWGWERTRSFKDVNAAADYVAEDPKHRVLFIRVDLPCQMS